ncbi:hypothetical protein [Asanoa sp. NPDC050611]|uniref:hypothetical protein n=1 Tax=Asanoa sp. NPDC050611 TaxID=3157098 RepID=UPI0033ED16B3
MFDAETTAIITGAAGSVVAHMLNGRVDAVREWAARIFRQESKQQRAQQLEAVEQDAAALASRTASKADVTARWAAVLGAYVASHPEVRADLLEMSASPVGSKLMYVQEQNNSGSGTFIGGDNYGRIAPSRGK